MALVTAVMVAPDGIPCPNTAIPGANPAVLATVTILSAPVVEPPVSATVLPSKPVFDEVTTKVPLLLARRLKVWACRVLAPVPRPPDAVEAATTVTPVPVDSVKVVAELMEATVTPTGKPAPTIGMPTTRFAVLATVTRAVDAVVVTPVNATGVVAGLI